ncbi:FkbM family methyltransferase [Kutzneria sp. CA-103260]|uniref:FkbM family methyltransferase n=1 Tax=Kutzneria sp. CA-103260 TaxID=2802641 RepID=UPI001BAE4DD6|nr:FkbM family methyltransferase [Kutzneria sp. CA-103260]QUQ67485.1 FkbM family methyltransferase [Kutzneria sp. CA-103260]
MTSLRMLPNGLNVIQVNQAETDYLYHEIFTDAVYLPPGGVTLPKRPVVVDVGANIGLFTLFAAREWPGALVHAFEPVPEVFDVLRDNIRALPGATAHNVALGGSVGRRELTYYPGYTMMSGFDPDDEANLELVRAHVANTAGPERRAAVLDAVDAVLAERLVGHNVACEVTTLTRFVADFAIERIDFLKVDVEGAEVEVLQGIDGDTWRKIGFLVVEVLDRDGELAAVRRILRESGFTSKAHQDAAYRGTGLHLVHARPAGL